MNDVKEILQVICHNEEIARKFFEIETSILTIHNFRNLFERLLTEIREKFDIPYVWISLTEKNDIFPLMQKTAPAETFRRSLKIVERATFLGLVGDAAEPILLNRDTAKYSPLLPEGGDDRIGSLAIAPLAFNGAVIGSLNLADLSPNRYGPGMDASLLRQLAVKVSICLSNVTAHEKLAMLAFRDPLTDLLNRRVMEQVLHREYTRAARYGTDLAVVFIDIDGFKAVNDRFGHDRGDEVLRYVAERLAAMSRQSDVVSRFAGDEFVVILPNTSPDSAYRFVDRLQTFFFTHPFEKGPEAVPVSVSCGVATARDPGVADAASLLKKADERLYASKNSKKG